MTPRSLLLRALAILAVAALISATIWVAATDRDLASASHALYCEDAAIWAAEEARGVPLEERVGQPDYRGIADDHCPGMRPAAPAQGVAFRVGNSSATVTGSTHATQRQLVRN